MELPQCVICLQTLSNDALRPSRLTRHLETKHPALKEKPRDFFESKKNGVKMSRLDSSGTLFEQNKASVTASYNIALKIAQDKKPHSIGESLIKPSILSAVELILGQKAKEKVEEMSLSDSTIKSRLDEMAADVLSQVIEDIKKSPEISIQCDESTDVSACSHLLVFVRYVKENAIQEDFLFSHEMETTCKGEDIFNAVNDFFTLHDIPWQKVVGVCTDGAPAMIGCKSGFVKSVKDKNPDIEVIHCIIHREALASKTLPPDLNSCMKLVIAVINYIKKSPTNSRLFKSLCSSLLAEHDTLLFHTEVRWLSRGKVLHRFVELKGEIEIFLRDHNKLDWLAQIQNPCFDQQARYLTDLFTHLNSLNTKLQGNNKTIVSHFDILSTFKSKLILWSSRVESNSIGMFENLDESVTQGGWVADVKSNVKEHLLSLCRHFEQYFPKLEKYKEDWKFLIQPFNTNVVDIKPTLQEEFLEFQNDSFIRAQFSMCQKLEEFWVAARTSYPNIGSAACKILCLFSSTYLCESAFSALVTIKTKSRNRLNVESDLRCAISRTSPRISLLVEKKQKQRSH